METPKRTKADVKLDVYAEKHNLEVIKTYYTYGDERIHYRAIARDKTTREQYYLYYDSSRKRQSLAQQKRAYDIYRAGGVAPLPNTRGWRNTTLANKIKIARSANKTKRKPS